MLPPGLCRGKPKAVVLDVKKIEWLFTLFMFIPGLCPTCLFVLWLLWRGAIGAWIPPLALIACCSCRCCCWILVCVIVFCCCCRECCCCETVEPKLGDRLNPVVVICGVVCRFCCWVCWLLCIVELVRLNLGCAGGVCCCCVGSFKGCCLFDDCCCCSLNDKSTGWFCRPVPIEDGSCCFILEQKI